jgi:general stress protein 26
MPRLKMEALMTTTTLPPVSETTESRINAYLAAAHEAVLATRICWLATRSLEGGTNVRAVDCWHGAPGSDKWTRRFLVRRTSRKVAEMRAAPMVSLACQHASGERWVALGGRATIIDDVAEMRMIWPGELDALFPSGFANANMIVVRLDVDRVEVHIRGLTPEPFGTGRTLLERQPGGSWRYIPAAPSVGIDA